MPKMKISRSVRDRFKVTGRGKVLRRKMGQRHLKNAKRTTSTRRGKRAQVVTGGWSKKIRRLLGR